jgi:hypothetical protein
MRRIVVLIVTLASVLLTISPTSAAAATTYQGKADTGGNKLNVRSDASTNSAILHQIEHGANLVISCQVTGHNIAGVVRTTRQWDKLSSGGYVSDAYVRRTASPPQCGGVSQGGSPPKKDRDCTIKDPTTNGCITPRMLQVLNQAKAAGFTRYVVCYRALEDGGEHPRGRACDFSAATRGFENVDATGGDRAYGDRFASWLIANAKRLGIIYVIWYKRIWMPDVGWRAYSGSGSPAARHTNHVHVSVR